ncbi:MAG: O-antigen ligase family protein [bacterium]
MKKYGFAILGVFIIFTTLLFANIMQFTAVGNLYTLSFILLISIGILSSISYFTVTKKYPLIIILLLSFMIICISTTIINSSEDPYTLMITVFKTMLWVIAFLVAYITTRKNNQSNLPFNMIALTLPLIAYMFYKIYQNQLILRSELINSIYYLLLLVPIILVVKQNTIKIIGLIIIFIGIVVSLKRTGLIAFLLSILVYLIILFLNSKKQLNKKNIKLSMLISLFIFAVGIYISYSYLSQYLNLDWISRMQALETDGGSGRTLIWQTTLEMQSKSDILAWLLGHGYNTVITDSPLGVSAHNDFIEVLYDYGAIGLTFYLGFIIALIQYCIKMYKEKFHLTAPFAASLVIFILMSFFSHLVLYPTYFIYLSLFWGISIAQYDNKYYINNIIKINQDI